MHCCIGSDVLSDEKREDFEVYRLDKRLGDLCCLCERCFLLLFRI